MAIKKSSAKADIRKNRLYIKVARKVTRQDLHDLYTDIRFCVVDLKPGFSVITDLAECSLAMLNGVSTFRKIAGFLIDKEVGTVVRVMNCNSLLFHQIVNLTSRTQGYNPVNVGSVEEAEELLDKDEGHVATRFRLYEHEVRYQLADETIAGILVDISVSGCSIRAEHPLPSVGDTLQVSIGFTPETDLLSSFESTATVVSVHDDCFAVEYTSIDDEDVQALTKRLQSESRCDVKF